MNRSAIAAALLCAACGNYSTEDLVFLAALPLREDLRADVPAQGTVQAATVCTIGSAGIWLEASPLSDAWNARVDLVIGLIDAVRSHPPTTRDDDLRSWGPFDDTRHPGRELRVVIVRSYPPDLGGEPLYSYVFQGRVKGTEAWTNLVAGAFAGPSASRGKGFVALDFDAVWAIGVNDAGTPHGTMRIGYDRTADPARVALTIALDASDLVQFDYLYNRYRDGTGAFSFRFRTSQGDVLTVQAAFDASGAGKDLVDFVGSGGGTATVDQCWDGSACLVYVDDPYNVTQIQACTTPPCPPVGSSAACPTVPPFAAPPPQALPP